MADSERLDVALVTRGLVPSRSRASRLVLAGQVRVDGQRVDKPATTVGPEQRIEVETPPPFVSRGGEKLDPVIDAAGVTVAERVALDIGASTGGFTDCLLQRGARQVVAVDVGYGQLDWRLRQDERVRVLERTNARHLDRGDLPSDLAGPIDLLVMDVSFIGVRKLLPALGRLCDAGCEALVLVKPQFEAGPDRVEKGGVVRSASTRREVVEAVAEAAAEQQWDVLGAFPSPLRGPAGNWECFLYLRRTERRGRKSAALGALAVPDDRPSQESS